MVHFTYLGALFITDFGGALLQNYLIRIYRTEESAFISTS